MIEENPSQKSQENTGTIVTTQSPPSTEVPSPPAIPLTQQQAASPPSHPPEHQEAETVEAIEKGLSSFERRILTATWAGVAAAAITGVFIYSQFSVMTDQTKILSDQGINAVADSIEAGKRVEKQLSIAQQQVAAAQASAEAIQRQVRQDQRAWMTVVSATPIALGIQFPVKVEDNIIPSVPMLFRNYGKTPAKKFIGRFSVEIVKTEVGPSFSYSQVSPIVRIGLIVPNQNVMESIERSFKFTAEEVREIKSGKSYIAFYGKATYVDVFDVQHWDTYCGWLIYPNTLKNDPPSTKKCVDYNNVDNN